ncbi:MAG: CarD family transcriptional regulator, partial [bacterium]
MGQSIYTGTNLGLFADWLSDQNGPTVSVVPKRQLGETLFVNLENFYGDQVGFLPAWDLNPGDDELPGESIQERRLELLNQIRRDSINHLVLSVRSMGTPVLSPDILESLTLEIGDRISPVQLNRTLTDLGFERQDLVEAKGDFALRGDLLDFYPERTPYPIRVTFFDDEIEDIEYFHPNTQMQADESPETPLTVHQQSEFALSPDEREALVEDLKQRGHEEQAEQLTVHPEPDSIASWFGLWPRETVNPESLLPGARFAVFRPADCWTEVEDWQDSLNENEDPLVRETFRDLETVLDDLTTPDAAFFSMHYQESPITPDTEPERRGEIIEVTSAPGAEPNPIQDFIELVEDLTDKTSSIVIHCGEEGFKNRLRDLLEDDFDSANRHGGTDISLLESPWHGSYRRNGAARLSLDDFFNRTIQRGRIGPNRSRTEYLESFEELQAGDLVVHEQHGIGRFQGLKRISTKNQTRDCLHIDYKGNDKLFLPPDQIAWVQKYVADSGFTP